MMLGVLLASLLLMGTAPQEEQAPDPNTPTARRGPRQLDFRVFNNMDRPVTGLWELEIPEAPTRRIELKGIEPGRTDALVGIEIDSGREVLRLERKKKGVGYEGRLMRVLDDCGLEALPVREFLPLGDAIVLRFEAPPTEAPCPPLDSGRAGRFHVVSRRGGPVRLRDLSEISSSSVRDTYGIGGDRPVTGVSVGIPLGAVSVEAGAEVKFLRRLKAPLDSSFWFQVEAVVSPAAGVDPPRGYVKGESLRFVGSLTLKRAR